MRELTDRVGGRRSFVLSRAGVHPVDAGKLAVAYDVQPSSTLSHADAARHCRALVEGCERMQSSSCRLRVLGGVRALSFICPASGSPQLRVQSRANAKLITIAISLERPRLVVLEVWMTVFFSCLGSMKSKQWG